LKIFFYLEDSEKPYNIRHRAFRFSKELVLFIKDASYDRIFFSMFDQLLRSGTSIGASLVEGRSGSSKKDWKNYYAVGLKSANETKYWICLIRDTMDLDKSKLNELLREADELSRIIASIITKE
jgi:four helix bundle protein